MPTINGFNITKKQYIEIINTLEYYKNYALVTVYGVHLIKRMFKTTDQDGHGNPICLISTYEAIQLGRKIAIKFNNHLKYSNHGKRSN
jgi:hypothetical protein